MAHSVCNMAAMCSKLLPVAGASFSPNIALLLKGRDRNVVCSHSRSRAAVRFQRPLSKSKIQGPLPGKYGKVAVAVPGRGLGVISATALFR